MIHKFCACLMVLILLASSASFDLLAQVKAGNILQDGTPVRIRINRTLSSADAKVGETVDFELLDEMKLAGTVIAPVGSVALATVTEAQSKRSLGRGGKLNVNIDHLRLVNGQKAPLRGVKEGEGGGHVAAMTGAIVATSIVFFPAAPLFLFVHGKDITIPKGTEVTVYVNGDFPVEIAKPQPTTTVALPRTNSAAGNDTAIVAVNSNPTGADITVDGKYMGNTPATLLLSAGDHVISLERSGFKPWQKKISAGAGSSLTIAPALAR